MPDRILVGRFGAPHGVRGEVRLQSFTQDPLAIARYGALVAADGRAFTLTGARMVKNNLLVVRVAGIADRTAAETLTNLDLTLDRAVLPPPEPDEFYLADLIGMEAYGADGARLGTVVDVPNFGAGDLVEVRPTEGGDSVLFPFTKAVVPSVNVTARRITINPPAEVEDDERAQSADPPSL